MPGVTSIASRTYTLVMAYRRDPELNRLVQELNDAADPAGALDRSPAADAGSDSALGRLLTTAIERNATDLLLIRGVRPMLRVHGALTPLAEDPLTSDDLRRMFVPALTPRMVEQFEDSGAVDFSLRHRAPGHATAFRFRANLHRQRGELAASLRVLPSTIPSPGELGLPDSIAALTEMRRGLVLICGPTGSGKTTTLASMVDLLNRTRPQHIVTIEDPIEYEHVNDRSVIEQIEVGRDTRSFADALRASLRQNPDVILVGEMRDHETISTALTAAETGHLILSTLHTANAAQAIHRIVDVFPAGQQAQVRSQLALVLEAIVAQQLIPHTDGRGRSLAVEVLLPTTAVRNHIRRDALQHLHSEITMGRRHGMVSFEDSLSSLVQRGLINAEEARLRASSSEEIDSILKGT